MKRLLVIVLCLLLIAFSAYAETALDTINDIIQLGVGEGMEITRIELDDRTLSIVVDFSNVDPRFSDILPDLATGVASGITDELLDHEELDSEWDIIFIEVIDVGYFFFTKDDITLNEYNMRYMKVYDDDFNSRITLIEPAPTPVPDIPMEQLLEQATRQYIDEKFSYTDIEYITVNPNYGTSTPDDYFVLPHLFWNGGAANQDLIAPLSDRLAEYLTASYPGVQELCIFWADPADNQTAVKRAYERKGGKLMLTDELWAKRFN